VALTLKLIGFLICVPGVVAGLIPFSVVWWSAYDFPFEPGPATQYAGVTLMAVGAMAYTWCAVDLARFGQGIPAPMEPTRFLVRRGIYRRVRNPMYLAACLVLTGEALTCSLGILFIYAAAVFLLHHLAVIGLEEPALRARFGAPYEEYCRQVPRWLIRMRPISAKSNI